MTNIHGFVILQEIDPLDYILNLLKKWKNYSENDSNISRHILVYILFLTKTLLAILRIDFLSQRKKTRLIKSEQSKLKKKSIIITILI